MRTREYIALSAATMMLTALGIDIMLPVFGEIRTAFVLPVTSTEPAHIVTYFFWGQMAQVVFGILSDRHGRLPILRLGFPLYIVGGIIAAFAPSLTVMYIARFVAGVGASAVFMTTIAGVRDRFVGDEMAKIMSLILTIFLFTPVVAPFLGIAILAHSNWHLVFLTPPLFAVLVFAWSFRLPETLPVQQRQRLPLRQVGRNIGAVISNGQFLRYCAITTLLFSGISTWVSSSEHLMRDVYGHAEWFAPVFASVGGLMAVAALTNSRLATRFGVRSTIRGLLVLYAVTALLFLVGNWVWTPLPPLWFFVICVAVLMATNLAIEPNSSALAMEPMGEQAGLAASVYGTLFFFIGASLSEVVSSQLTHRVLPMGTGFAVIALTCMLLAFTDKGKRQAGS